MTKPRIRPDRELFGIIGALDDTSAMRRQWNKRLTEEGIDAFMDYYPTKKEQVSERLSEMFHFDRRAYVVGKALREAIIPLLDRLDPSVEGEGMGVNFVLNSGGVFTGFWCDDFEEMWKLSVSTVILEV